MSRARECALRRHRATRGHGQGRDQGGRDPRQARQRRAHGILLRQAQEPEEDAEEARVRQVRPQGATTTRRRRDANARAV